MPRCSHGNDASMCSQCAGAEPRVVTQAGRELLVDGAPFGLVDEVRDTQTRTTRSQRKGGATRTGRSKP